jgi:hypothetical protein
MQLSMSKIRREKGNLSLTGITSKAILTLLKARHYQDVFIPECKNGETWGARDLLKLDAWVLCRTYSPLRIIGYEIKVKRNDFERDTKWEKYLQLCHEFYFVCPAGLIRNHDLPSRVGLIWASKDYLYTKRRAERIDPDWDKLTGLLIYALMARAQIVANMFDRDKEPEISHLEQIRQWIEEANARKELAIFVKGHIRQIYDRIMGLEFSFKQREDHIKYFQDALAKLGITWNPEDNSWYESQRVREEIYALKKTIDLLDIRQMRSLAESLSKAANELESIIKDNS